MFKHAFGCGICSQRFRRRSVSSLTLLAAAVVCGLHLNIAHAQYNVSAPVILQDFNSSYLSIQNKMPDIFASGYGAVYLPPPGYSTSSNNSPQGSGSGGYAVY